MVRKLIPILFGLFLILLAVIIRMDPTLINVAMDVHIIEVVLIVLGLALIALGFLLKKTPRES